MNLSSLGCYRVVHEYSFQPQTNGAKSMGDVCECGIADLII